MAVQVDRLPAGPVAAGLGWGVEARFEGMVFGVDEVGRGPWAGPVLAAAVCLSCASVPAGLGDSKVVPALRRAAIAAALEHVAYGEASVAEIDRINIRNATFLAMARAVRALARRLGPPAVVLVDGNALPAWSFRAEAIIGGDATVATIAAASIAAKVLRDRMMHELAIECPGYGWERNKGYGTPEHAEALERHGPSRHHRRSFAPVARAYADAALKGLS